MSRRNLLNLKMFATCNIRFRDPDASADRGGSFAQTRQLGNKRLHLLMTEVALHKPDSLETNGCMHSRETDTRKLEGRLKELCKMSCGM